MTPTTETIDAANARTPLTTLARSLGIATAFIIPALLLRFSGIQANPVLSLIAVLPEYAVDLYYAFTAGHNPAYVQYAAANMTGSNRLLMGIGWPVVVLIAVAVARKATGKAARGA